MGQFGVPQPVGCDASSKKLDVADYVEDSLSHQAILSGQPRSAASYILRDIERWFRVQLCTVWLWVTGLYRRSSGSRLHNLVAFVNEWLKFVGGNVDASDRLLGHLRRSSTLGNSDSDRIRALALATSGLPA